MPRRRKPQRAAATPQTRKKNNTVFDQRTGRLVNTECPICRAAGRDPMGHVARSGKPSCRGHLHARDGIAGRPCTRLPMRGQGVCMMHGGKVGHNMEAARKRLALVNIRKELDHLGGSLDVDPATAMLAMVHEAAFNVAFLRRQVNALRPGFESTHGAGDGIVGRVDPENWSAAEHVLVGMYDRERDRLTRYSKMCRDAGIEERRVKIEEEQGRWLTKTLDLLLDRLALTEDQQAALPTIMREVIDVLEVGERQALEAATAGTPLDDDEAVVTGFDGPVVQQVEDDDGPPPHGGTVQAPTPPPGVG
jgi:hypothetical protein